MYLVRVRSGLLYATAKDYLLGMQLHLSIHLVAALFHLVFDLALDGGAKRWSGSIPRPGTNNFKCPFLVILFTQHGTGTNEENTNGWGTDGVFRWPRKRRAFAGGRNCRSWRVD